MQYKGLIPVGKKVFLDIECYRNYFLICFKSNSYSKYYEFTSKIPINLKEINNILNKYTTVGYNSLKYDLPMLVGLLRGYDNSQLKDYSDELILSDKPSWVVMTERGIKIPQRWDHIDLIEPAPAVGVSLKTYGARMHTKTLQDLPIDPDNLIRDEDHALLREYCFNDLSITMELYEQIKDRIELREKIGKDYSLELRSKSDAQVAEMVIRKLLNVTPTNNDIDVSKVYKYSPSHYLKFRTENTKSFYDKLLQEEFKCDEKGYLLKNKDSLPSEIEINGNKFSVGIGGLHSNEKHLAVVAGSDEFILDVDVISYYPNIILNNKYYPEKLGVNFLNLYETFYKERLHAKANNDKLKSDTFKLILNGSFGKFGSPYSILYAPSLLLHTTLTGQLCLLMLIELLLLESFEVISANTDGITIKGKLERLSYLDILLKTWCMTTGYKLEKTSYKAIYHESVNSYIAIKENNEVKCKGLYAYDSLTKNPTAPICIDAIIQYLCFNIPLEETIINNKHDITKFLIARKVSQGGKYGDLYLGKVVRWYYGYTDNIITYRVNNNKVPSSEGAVPLMTITKEQINDINIDTYLNKCVKMLKCLGVKYETI